MIKQNPEERQNSQKTGFLFHYYVKSTENIRKVQKISELQQSLSLFSISENYELFYSRFLESDLGEIYQSIPWENLVACFGLKQTRLGRTSLFSPKGRIALMFLKNYTQVSDKKLIEQLNGNLEYQFFCDLSLGAHRLTNTKIVSQIRCELSEKLSIDDLEKVLYNYWKPYINEERQAVVDATCYESEVRYPSIWKLLWEAVSWLYNQLRKNCKALGVKMIRSKFLKWEKRYISFSKMRRKTQSKRRSLTRALLKLLHKFLTFEKTLHASNITYSKNYYKRISVISKIYEQQFYHFKTGEKIKNRIVSINKDYIRPIVRGKEIKKVEMRSIREYLKEIKTYEQFGAKVNKVQIDGLSFIEHLSFDAFNEGVRLQSSVYKIQQLTHKKLRILGADAIYATNKNRTYVRKHQITTDFKPKGRKSKSYKEEQKVRRLITKERATRLEGSFGVEKEHYHLKKIKAKNDKTETLWIFFGIHVKNALEIGRRIDLEKKTNRIA